MVGAVLMLTGGVAAKLSHCRKDCKQDIKNCLALVLTNKACTGAKAEKTACRKMHAAQRKACRGLVKLCKRQNPGTDGVCVPSRCGTFLTTWGRRGSGNGQFDNPVGVAVDGSGNVFVADSGNLFDADSNNARIQKFDHEGTFLTTWGTSGSGNGQFRRPVGVAVDGSGNVFVADTDNARIQKFDSGGTFLTTWGTFGSANGQFMTPVGVAVDGSGNVFVTDFDNNRIQKFDNGGTFLTTWGTFGSGNGQFAAPLGVAVDGSRNVFVAEAGNNRIQKFACP